MNSEFSETRTNSDTYPIRISMSLHEYVDVEYGEQNTHSLFLNPHPDVYGKESATAMEHTQ